jgi:hypothetical protein
MSYIEPKNVHSPKARWKLIRVLKAGQAGECAYALGEWDGARCIGFRWNGEKDNPIGNPQSRGLPTWTILDEESYEPLLSLLPNDEKNVAREWLGIILIFEHVTLDAKSSDVALWDLGRNPPVIAKIPCAAVKDLIKDSAISNENCRLLIECNKDLITQVAEGLFVQEKYRFNDNRCRIIDISTADLKPTANQFSTTVLQTKLQWLQL